MKDAKKSAIKKLKKNTKQVIEKDLSDKLHTFISSLGHDVEDIGLELKKASKILAKKLVKKFSEVKSAVSEKTNSVKVKTPKIIKKVKTDIENEASETKAKAKKVKTEIANDASEIKNKVKSVTKAKPVITANKVKPIMDVAKKEISNVKKAAKAAEKPVLAKVATTKKAIETVAKPVTKRTPKVKP